MKKIIGTFLKYIKSLIQLDSSTQIVLELNYLWMITNLISYHLPFKHELETKFLPSLSQKITNKLIKMSFKGK